LQRWDGTRVIAVFVAAVIFDDEAIGFLCPLQQLCNNALIICARVVVGVIIARYAFYAAF
jgi:hypothetical protein